MACDPATLAALSKAFQGVDDRTLNAIQAYLLCQIQQNPVSSFNAAAITGLPAASALTGAEIIAGVQSGTLSQFTVDQINTYLSSLELRAFLTSVSAYTSNATPANITDLSLNVVAGTKYSFEAYFIFQWTTGGTGGGLKLNFNGGSAAATVFSVVTSAVQGTSASSNALATTMTFAPVGLGTIGILVEGVFIPSSSGTIILMASQNTSGTNTSSILAGSWIHLE